MYCLYEYEIVLPETQRVAPEVCLKPRLIFVYQTFCHLLNTCRYKCELGRDILGVVCIVTLIIIGTVGPDVTGLFSGLLWIAVCVFGLSVLRFTFSSVC